MGTHVFELHVAVCLEKEKEYMAEAVCREAKME